jgi:CIC family chloride channel protein
MELQGLYHKLLLLRVKYLSNRHFMLLLAFIIGLAGGLAAVVLKTGVHYIQHLLTLGVPARYHNYLFFVYPAIGILLAVLYRLTFKHAAFGHGMTGLMMDISKRSSLIKPENMYNHMVSAAMTVGFGGSVGLESPIVYTGAAIGSNLARFFHLGYKKRTLMIGCGVAAGIGGIFNAPIAGLIFCLEVLLLELAIPAFVPLLISSVTGTIVSRLILGSEILFNSAITDAFFLYDIPFYILLGSFTGLLSIYFLRQFNKTVELMHKVHNSVGRSIVGGLFLGLMIFIFPPLYGEGYGNIKQLLSGGPFTLLHESYFFHAIQNDWFVLAFAGGIIALKVFASSVTIGGGGNGGNFAPSLFLGGICGFFISHLINTLHFFPFALSEKNFILVGMAGMMTGILRAPLTAIFLIAEITGGYTLILPLMIVAAISYAASSYLEPHSVYISQLAKKGVVSFHDKDRLVLNTLKLNKLIEKDFVSVRPEGTLKDLVDAVSVSKRNIFPVVDDEEKLRGIIQLDDIRRYMFKPDLYSTMKVTDFMHQPPAYITYTETMEEAMRKFDQTNAWNLPVINHDGIYIGLMSKSKIFSSYRRLLKKQVKEDTEIIE